MQMKNLDKIRKMALFKDNWNGTGGERFSSGAISYFEKIIKMLKKQPEIAPTGRNSLLMQYELDNRSLLVFEISENKVEKIYIPKGDYSKAQKEIFLEDVEKKIKECIELFYS